MHRFDGGVIAPGLVDCHTHLVFAGDRAAEFELRLQGASYEHIARAGGGIRPAMRAVRGERDALLAESLPRARALVADGATTLEIKSGYGLDFDNERKMLRVARRIGDELGVGVRTTCLAAHALPPEFANDPDGYIDAAIGWLPALQAEGLIDAVDAFCEGIGFTPAQTRRMFEAARALGLPVKLHADQLSDLGGAALAAGFDGPSADHIEYTSDEGVRAMAAHGTVAVLLPGAFHVLRETKLPPLDALRARGVPMAVATDCNPVLPPLLSLRQAMQLACTHFKLTPEEALRGATINAARGAGPRGSRRAARRHARGLRALAHPPPGGTVLLARRRPRRRRVRGRETHRLNPVEEPMRKTLLSASLLLSFAIASPLAMARAPFVVDTHIDARNEHAALGRPRHEHRGPPVRWAEGACRRLGVAFMSIYTSPAQDGDGTAWKSPTR